MYPGSTRDFITVGMPDTAVRESRERIKSALLNSGFGYPSKAVTINLAPANVRKEGAGFDLPMALGILGAMGRVQGTDQHLLIGELSLDGSIRPVRGALSIAVCARRRGIPNLVVPRDNAAEAAVVEGVRVYGLAHLAEVVDLVNHPERHTPSSNGHRKGRQKRACGRTVPPVVNAAARTETYTLGRHDARAAGHPGAGRPPARRG